MLVKDFEPFISSSELVAELSKGGISYGPRTPYEWARRVPGLGIKIAGRRMFSARVPRLILDGVPLREIPERLRDYCDPQTTSPAGGQPVRRRADIGDTRVRR